MPPRRVLSARNSTTVPSVEEAERDVATARAVVEGVRRLVSERREGAASLATAEYRLNAALRQLDEAREHEQRLAIEAQPREYDADPEPAP